MNKIVLCGNPNTGKTTIFNALTKSQEKVGNFHGVTVDKKVKNTTLNNKKYQVVDLPGIYSLDYFSLEEKLSIEYIKKLDKNDIILYIIDESKIKRNLYLYFELKEIGFNIILCINKIDKNKVDIDYKKFKKIIKDNYFIFSKKTIKQELSKNLEKKFINYNANYLDNLIKKYDYNNLDYEDKFYLIKKLENSTNYKNNDIFCDENGNFDNVNHFDYLVSSRYKCIKDICKKSNFSVKKFKKNIFDDLLTNKYFSIIFFILMLSMVFYVTFGPFSQSISNFLSNKLYALFNLIKTFFLKHNFSIFITRFITEGIYLGISLIISFLPQLFILFLCFSFLEESGYLARLSFIFDDFLSKFGLNGKSIFTLLMSFGCSTSACFQARTNQNEHTKTKLALITPYFSCSAKIPIYLLLINAFFPKISMLVLLGLYLLGIIFAFFSLSIFNKLLPDKEESFILEIPSLKFPSIRKIMFSSFRQTKDFFVKIASYILIFNCIVWIISNCNFSLIMVDDIKNSMLYKFGSFFSIIFKPLGFGNASIVSALLCGIMAKEIILSTFGIFNSKSFLPLSTSITLSTSLVFFTKSSALSFLVFVLLYCPCISNYFVIKQEIGKNARFGVILQIIIAYIASFITYILTNLYLKNSLLFFIILIIMVFGLLIISFLKKHKKNQF